jgi:hypothetical protein
VNKNFDENVFDKGEFDPDYKIDGWSFVVN